MGNKGRIATLADRFIGVERIRVLRRRTRRWFTPPVRPGDENEPFDDPGERATRASSGRPRATSQQH